MTNLIAHGCSFTYGHGLQDCHIPPNNPGHKHSKFAWPSKVGKHFNYNVVNLSHPGASNKLILHKVLEYKDYKKDDVVVILWTYNRRWSEIFSNEKHEDYGPWSDKKIVRDFLISNNDFDQILTLNHQMALAYYHLKELDVKQIHIKIKLEEYKKMKWCPVKIEKYDFSLRSDYPRALDGGHPGQEAHDAFANLVINSIDNINKI